MNIRTQNSTLFSSWGIMTPWHEIPFRITDPLFPGRIPSQRASNVELVFSFVLAWTSSFANSRVAYIIRRDAHVTSLYSGYLKPSCWYRWWLLPHINISYQIARFLWPTWGPPGSCRPQMGPMFAPWILLSGIRRSRTTPGITVRADVPVHTTTRPSAISVLAIKLDMFFIRISLFVNDNK